jgi:hypothetical protein
MAARNQAGWFSVIARKKGPQVKLYSRPGMISPIVSRWSSRRWHACARGPASSMGRRLPVMTTASLRSISSATAIVTKAYACMRVILGSYCCSSRRVLAYRHSSRRCGRMVSLGAKRTSATDCSPDVELQKIAWVITRSTVAAGIARTKPRPTTYKAFGEGIN